MSWDLASLGQGSTGVQRLTGDQAEIPTLLASGDITGMSITDGKLLVRKEPTCMF